MLGGIYILTFLFNLWPKPTRKAVSPFWGVITLFPASQSSTYHTIHHLHLIILNGLNPVNVPRNC